MPTLPKSTQLNSRLDNNAIHISGSKKLRHYLVNMLRTLSIWRTRARHRRELAQVDTRLMQDMGLTTSDIHEEISKPFWKP